MRRRGSSLLFVAVAIVTLLVYATLAFAVYRALLVLWAQRPDPLTTGVVLVVVTVVMGFAGYRIGTARVRFALDAVELPRAEAPHLYRRVDHLAERVGVETPRLLIASLSGPNALALGGARGGDVVLDGSLFRLLSADELAAIVAHELSHLKRRDSLVKTVGYSFGRLIAGGVWLVLLPVALLVGGVARAVALVCGRDPVAVRRMIHAADAAVSSLVVVCLFVLMALVRAYSRRREYAADDRAAQVVDPLAMARALEKIDRATTPGGLLSTLVVHGDEEGPLTDLLASHPPMDERIDRLRRQAAEEGEPRGRR
ncbi:M48 family metallopeptidase [Haloplanus litoreus]|uniref:M48 family metallopeptidase n=1 Tax=Haloplanus litoreus TaxID=767515 RepID=A0ABD5ZVW2_9EURY